MEQEHEMINFEVKKVKGQGHKRSKIDVDRSGGRGI